MIRFIPAPDSTLYEYLVTPALGSAPRNVIVDLAVRRLYLAVAMGMDTMSEELSRTNSRINENRFLFNIFSPNVNSKLTLRDDIYKDWR